METHKRNRDEDGTLVTFYAPNRTFARVYKGQSLEETRSLVRKKLGLPDDTSIRFSRLHEGKVIELDDDEDFEAFRHLARYVPSLDVSVFVGQTGPPLFTQQATRESTVNLSNPKRRPKKRQAAIPSSVSPLDSTTNGITFAKDRPSNIPDSSSTLDVNGVPKKKRKRKDGTHIVDRPVSSPVSPLPAFQTVPDGHETSSFRNREPAPQRTRPILPPSPHGSEPPAIEALVPRKGSKRKRQDSPETPAAVPLTIFAPTVPPPPSPARSASLSSPAKKKRRKNKRAEDSPAVTPVQMTATRFDKTSKRKPNDTVSASPPPAAAPLAAETDLGTEDTVVGRKATKKAKTEAKLRTVEDDDATASSKEDAKKSKKRKDKESNREQGFATTPVESSPNETPPASIEPAKEKRKKRTEATELPEAVPSASPTPTASTDATAAKSSKEKRRKAKGRHSEQLNGALAMTGSENEPVAGPSAAVEPEADGELKGKKVRRRKTLPATLASNAEEATSPMSKSSAAEPVSHEDQVTSTTQDSSESASAKKSKRDRKSLSALSSHGEGSTSETAAFSAVRAAAEAVLARASSTSAGPNSAPASQQSAPPLSEAALPGKKRKSGKSKLSQAWGPNDLVEEQESACASVATPALDSTSASAASVPSTFVKITAKTKAAHAQRTPRPSSAPTCPICDEPSLHPRSQCPVVEAGPMAIRKRIAQLKKSGDYELAEELDVLYKEAQRRRKSAGGKRAANIAALTLVPAANAETEVPQLSPSMSLQSSSTSALSRPRLGDRSLSSPRLPAGSEISEVVVESKDEGSSNESSSDDEDEGPVPTASSLPLLDPTNLEALLYVPVKPRVSVLAQIPSSSESSEGEESDDEPRNDKDIDMDEEDKHDRAYRRMSRKFAHAGSSSDEDEPQPDSDQAQELDSTADTDVDDHIISPTEMDPGPNNSIDRQDAQQVEADMLAQDTSAIERPAKQLDDESVVPGDHRELSESDEDEDEKEVEAQAKSSGSPEPHAAVASNAETSEADIDEPQGIPEDRGDDRRADTTAVVDPLSQAHPEPKEPEGSEADDGAKQQPDGGDTVDVSAEAPQADENVPEPDARVDFVRDGVPSEADDVEQDAPAADLRKSSPELGGDLSPALSGTTAQAEVEKVNGTSDREDESAGEDTAMRNEDDMQVEVVEPYAEDPNDPIDAFSSDHDAEQDDPIEDPDVTQAPAQEREHTPPPATPRTPGTVGRMKDRYGRLSQARGREAGPRLSQLVLGDLALSQEDITLKLPAPAGTLEPSLISDPEAQAEMDDDPEADEPEPAKTPNQSMSSLREPQQEAQGKVADSAEVQPRRPTRATRRTTSIAPSSSLPEPEPEPTPTPAPTQRRGRPRLTAEEKARREAEKAVIAANRAAARQQKAAEKKAAKEARDAAKQAAKDAKQREKAERAQAKRGGARSGRGRGGLGKPVSTRSQRVKESVEPEDEEGVDEDTSGLDGREAPSAADVANTPGVAKISWAVLPQSDLGRTQESVGETSMIDELQPSSPEVVPPRALYVREESPARDDTITQEHVDEHDKHNPAVTPKSKSKGATKDPLFIPSSSQHPPTPFSLPAAESTPFANGNEGRNNPDDNDDDGEPEEEPERTFTAPTRSRGSWLPHSLYPSLTVLAGQALFPTSQISSPALFSQTPRQEATYKRSPATYGNGNGKDKEDDDDDDDDSSDESDSSDSDGCTRKKSHIPQSRRAGAGVQRKKKSRLLSAYT
ncbi:hypothetical protein BD311DRAFT_787763 [Dichomitus squalens]|uniref:Uncharacterized protein n=1 Tax=Dichomitus squalens TaxID=114155 RepID=A0A4Q9MPA0_9APHY|nr:hypothetical protein BD311DRAFT_787763 [Dichomitus squalens]